MNIGQKVVCIRGYASRKKTHRIVEGQIYTIKKISACKCGLMLHVGLITGLKSKCNRCNSLISDNGEWWHSEGRFAPLEEMNNHEKETNQLLKDLDLQTSGN